MRFNVVWMIVGYQTPHYEWNVGYISKPRKLCLLLSDVVVRAIRHGQEVLITHTFILRIYFELQRFVHPKTEVLFYLSDFYGDDRLMLVPS